MSFSRIPLEPPAPLMHRGSVPFQEAFCPHLFHFFLYSKQHKVSRTVRQNHTGSHLEPSFWFFFPAAVEACVLHGLKRRAAGFLRSNKVAALFMKVGKSFAPAEELCKKAQELEQVLGTK